MERSADWMDQARGDLDHARADLAGGFYEWACFSAQQAAEKAVNAVFQKLGDEAWGHSVAGLLQELAQRREVPQELQDLALELDKAYIPPGTPTCTRGVLPGACTPGRRRSGSSRMRTTSWRSVKVFSPRLSREQVLEALRGAVGRLRARLPVRRVVLFGSYARGDFTAASDVDLLVVYADPAREDAFGVVKRAVGLPHLEPHVFSESEFEAVKDGWKRPLAEGVVVYEETPAP